MGSVLSVEWGMENGEWRWKSLRISFFIEDKGDRFVFNQNKAAGI
jgi:hypothetical protein